MTTIHMIYGYLGVGKTSFARHLETTLPALRFTHDHWMTQLYGSNPPADEMPELCARVSSLMKDTWTKCAAMGCETVLDLNFWSKQERDETYEIAKSLNAEVKLYALELPEAEAMRRIEQRNKDLQGSFYISENTYHTLKAAFDPLTAEEAKRAIVPNY